MWFAGLPAAVRGRKLEAVKQAGDDPPAESGAGYYLAHTAAAAVSLPPKSAVRLHGALYFSQRYYAER